MRAILTYHSLDTTGSPISVSPEVFRAHCEFLASGRVPVVPLETLVENPPAGDAIALTFDDGFVNFETHAAPLLEQHALPATLFVVSDHVGGHNDWGGRPAGNVPHLPLLSWPALAALQNRGVKIGAHSRRHRPLAQLQADVLADEVQGSVLHIESALGRRPAAFAYPFGDVSPRAAAAVRAVCPLACTTALRALGSSEDPVLLPRVDMYYFRERGQLEAWGTAAFRSRLWLRGQGRRLRQLAAGAARNRDHAA
jgi:peptidoglycan/xylan/chitin deacetylase (PgdA/CDA1 family)